jgi:hypothetical protein
MAAFFVAGLAVTGSPKPHQPSKHASLSVAFESICTARRWPAFAAVPLGSVKFLSFLSSQPAAVGATKKGPRPFAVTLYAVTVPKTGLEPAPPLQGLGPEFDPPSHSSTTKTQ